MTASLLGQIRTPNKDPELWFNDMDHLNIRLRRITLKCKKDKLQMKSHMRSKEVVLQFRTLVKAGGKTDSETFLASNVSTHPYKKFKGYCRNCGKIGHKVNEFRSAKVETTGGDTKTAGSSYLGR